MRKFLAAATLALVTVLPGAWAADEVSPARLAAAGELMEASGAAKVLTSSDALMDAMVEQVRKTVPGIDDATVQALQKIVREEYNIAKPQILDQAKTIYARHFTEADMRKMIEFYRSETGQKVVAEMPSIMRESAPLSTEVSSRVVKRFIAYMQERAATNKDKPAQ